MALRAVAFDLDGTLYPNRRMYLRSAFLYLRHPRLVHKFSEVRREIRRIRPIDDLHTCQAELLAGKLGISETDARHKIDDIIYRQWELTFRKVKPFNSVRSVLGVLRERGYTLHLLTDFPVGRKLEYLGVSDMFECALSSEESGYLKPNPEPFLHLAECAGVQPDEMAFVGNNYPYDIVGARETGMQTIYLVGTRRGRSVPGISISRFSGILAAVDEVARKN